MAEGLREADSSKGNSTLKLCAGQAGMCNYCAFYDRNIKLGNMLEHIRRFYSYKDICDCAVYKNGGQFSEMVYRFNFFHYGGGL